MKIIQKIDFDGDEANAILAVMRSKMPGDPSWSVVRKLLRGRKVAIGGVICLDEGRRVTPGETLTIYDQPLPPHRTIKTSRSAMLMKTSSWLKSPLA